MLDKHKAEWFKAATSTEYSEKSKTFSKNGLRKYNL